LKTEEGTFEFRDPKLERLVGLTAADRKWMDDIVRDVNETWDEEDHARTLGMQWVQDPLCLCFEILMICVGSKAAMITSDLRYFFFCYNSHVSNQYLVSVKFEEYVSAALASVKYQEFISKGESSGVLITGGTGESFSSWPCF
jgi:hypothetical protein